MYIFISIDLVFSVILRLSCLNIWASSAYNLAGNYQFGHKFLGFWINRGQN